MMDIEKKLDEYTVHIIKARTAYMKSGNSLNAEGQEHEALAWIIDQEIIAEFERLQKENELLKAIIEDQKIYISVLEMCDE